MNPVNLTKPGQALAVGQGPRFYKTSAAMLSASLGADSCTESHVLCQFAARLFNNVTTPSQTSGLTGSPTYSLEREALVATKQNTDFKDPLYMTAWLDGALKKEKEKYKKCPVMPDGVPGWVDAQAWGYIVTGYFLAEQSFKVLLYLRGKETPKKHSLSTLFNSYADNDKKILREYYTDYRATISGNRGRFRFNSLDDFLVNLDGDTDSNQGSLAWRYSLIEEVPEMPFVSIDYPLCQGSCRL